MGDGVLLRDHPAHRDAEQVEALEPERIDETGEVVPPSAAVVYGPGGSRRLADAPVVVGDDAVALGEGRELEPPTSPSCRRGR